MVGARPQFIKAALVSAELRKRNCDEVLVHTGQHYDFNMSKVFFEQLSLPEPDYYLGVGSASHAAQTAEMMKRLEPLIRDAAIDWVVVYGDTNTTIAGALVASKTVVPLAHVEAGLRSFNRAMPEEINRIVADHLAQILFAPHERAARQLEREGIDQGVHVVGDLMVDSVLSAAATIPSNPWILQKLGVAPQEYAVVTVHRAANTDSTETFNRILAGLRRLTMPVVFPVHPRTAHKFGEPKRGAYGGSIIACEPVPYLEMIALEKYARVILTDSGGVQKEAYALSVPCVTLREETEWVETLHGGWNALAGSDPDKICALAVRRRPDGQPSSFYGDGRAAKNIVSVLKGEKQTMEDAAPDTPAVMKAGRA